MKTHELLTAISLPMPWFAPVTNARRLTAAAAIVCVELSLSVSTR
jgi:hypothetical protein